MRTDRTSRGLTLVELMIGLMVTSLVMGALAVFVSAVAQGWEAQDGTQDIALESHQAYQRVQSRLASALYIGSTTFGSLDGSAFPAASVFFWANENWAGDECPEMAEMAAIVHDPTTQTLWLYESISPAAMSGSQQAAAGAQLTFAAVTGSTEPAIFEAQNFVQKIPLAHDVIGATFSTLGDGSTTQRPIVEFTLVFSKGNQTVTQYGTATLRAPSTQPSP